ncbi:MAG: hypothetical protein GXO45_01535 [Aquificae bacterium]|nr:hypothetical protein [Aquificota bacterium]
MKDKFRGALLGGAIGDSMGMCVEELPMDEVIMYYGDKIVELCDPHPSSPYSFLKKGENTSAFKVVEMVAQSLIEKKGLDIKDIVKRYINWLEKEEEHTYPDPTFLSGVQALKEGRDIEKGGASAYGVLPAIPIGMFHYTNPALAVEGTKAVVMLTHRDEIAIDSASILAVSISEALQGRFYFEEEYPYFIELLKTFTTKTETKQMLDKLKKLLDKNASYEEGIEELGNGVFALETVLQALFVFLKTPQDPYTTIIQAVNSYGYYGGNTSVIGLIAGALSGALNGEDKIPAIWRTKLVKYKDIIKLADGLYSVAYH